MFEAIHGSAPRMMESGLGDYANPESILRAAVMLLRHIGLAEKAQRLSHAIDQAALLPMTGDANGATCAQFGDAVLQKLG